MAELTTIARPYAEAVFKRASETRRFQEWSDVLALLAGIAMDSGVQDLVASAKLPRDQLVALFGDICGDRLDAEGNNLVRLLTENRRLSLLPEIVALYEALRAEAEGTIEAEMISAYPVDAAQQDKIAQALKQRLGRDVSLKVSIDESLLGGAIIRAGDMVIDGSVRGKLAKLAGAVNQ